MRIKQCWNHKWAFSKEAAAVPEQMPSDWIWVNLPHTWNAIDGQDGGADYYRGTCYYAKTIYTDELPEGEDYYLEINGANSSADVFVNGNMLAHHDGGYSTFRVDLTECIARAEEAPLLVVIAVDNSANDTVYPQNADFTFYGGLYRDVNLIAVPKSHFALDYYGGPGLKVTPKLIGDDAFVEIKVWLDNAKKGQQLRYRVYDREGTTIDSVVCAATENKAALTIKQAHRWHGRRDPYLYTAEVTLLCDGQELDCVRTKFGCRSFLIDPDKGFFLNGESYPLRGVSRHQDWWGIGNALLPEHHEKDMELICEVGATTIRLAHYQHDQYFYDLCDERGMVVWAEIPYISSHMEGGIDNTVSQMKELIIQNYNHPSIVVWGLSNEITMSGSSSKSLIENHKMLNDLAHDMDKTRLTTMAVITMCDMHDPYVQIPDVVSYNHYFGWYGGEPSMNGPWLDAFHKTFPKLPIGLSEYGCEALDWHSSNPVQGDYTEEYQAYYHEELIKQLFTRDYLWATHVWNMFDFGADARNEGGEYGQNHKGLVSFNRKYKKDAFYAYKAWLSDVPFVHICGKRYVDRVEEVTKVTVYSNQPEVELIVNGKSLGIQTSDVHFFYFEVPNVGESTLVAVAGVCTDTSHIRRVSEPNEAYILKEKGAVLNWFDITEHPGYFSLNDKLGDIMETPEGEALLEGLLRKMNGPMGSDQMMGDAMKTLAGGFTGIRFLNTFGVMAEHLPSKEELLAVNARLNQIKKRK